MRTPADKADDFLMLTAIIAVAIVIGAWVEILRLASMYHLLVPGVPR